MSEPTTKTTAWDLLGADPNHPGAARYTAADLAAAQARGYRKAVEALRAMTYVEWKQLLQPPLRVAPDACADYLESLASPKGEPTP